MNIQIISLDRLNPAAYNSRADLQPGDPEYEKLRRSIEIFVYVEPIVWNERTGNIIGGHQRYKMLCARGDTGAAGARLHLHNGRYVTNSNQATANKLEFLFAKKETRASTDEKASRARANFKPTAIQLIKNMR